MTVSPVKSKAIILCLEGTDNTHKLRIYDNEIETPKSVILLGVST